MNEILKKRIEEAADKHSFKYLSQDRIEELELGCHYEAGFIAGAEYALSHQWISVKDRMPEYCKVVFVLHSSKVIEVSAYHADNNWSNFDDDIIAWMPIPPFEDILQANKDVLMRLKYM